MHLIEKELLRLRPKMNPSCKTTLHGGGSYPHYFVVQADDRYIRVGETFFRLFESMDGESPVGHIVERVFDGNEKPELQTIARFLALVYRNGMILAGSPGEKDVLDKLLRSGDHVPSTLFSRLGGRVLKSKIAFKRADKLVSELYSRVGRFLFTRTSLALMSVVSLSGVALFMAQLVKGNHSAGDLLLLDGSFALGIMAAYCSIPLSMIVHELGHALTCKHFGRRVAAMGLMLYYGVPACYTDTTDCWMLPRRKRIVVDVAGMIANISVGSMFSIAAVLSFSPTIHRLCAIGAIANFLAVLANLTPFLKYDGYYILADLLNRPNLREEAIASLFTGERWRELLTRKDRSRAEIGVFIFGLCSVAYAGVAVAFFMTMVFMAMLTIIPGPYDVIFASGAVVILTYSIGNYAVRKVQMCKEISSRATHAA